LAERWNGTTWTRQPMAKPGGSQLTNINGVSCANGAVCAAVGNWSGTPNGLPSVSLAETWNGTAWAVMPTPNPQGAELSSLEGVACPGVAACFAVGNWYDGHINRTLVEAVSS
jgi:hypothetical protein